MADFYLYHNQKVLERGMTAFIKNKGMPMMKEKLKKVQKEMRGVIDEMVASGKIPVYTGQLRNSIGVAVYENNKLLNVLTPTKGPFGTGEPQSAGAAVAGVAMWGIIGANLLQNAANNPTHLPGGAPNISLVIYAGVPYAWWVNEYGAPHSKEKFGKGHRWGAGANPKTASGGDGQMFYNNLVGSELWLRLGREFFKGNKNFISDHEQY